MQFDKFPIGDINSGDVIVILGARFSGKTSVMNDIASKIAPGALTLTIDHHSSNQKFDDKNVNKILNFETWPRTKCLCLDQCEGEIDLLIHKASVDGKIVILTAQYPHDIPKNVHSTVKYAFILRQGSCRLLELYRSIVNKKIPISYAQFVKEVNDCSISDSRNIIHQRYAKQFVSFENFSDVLDRYTESYTALVLPQKQVDKIAYYYSSI